LSIFYFCWLNGKYRRGVIIKGETNNDILLSTDDSISCSKLEEIYNHYKKEMQYTAFSLVRKHDSAEDIVHNAILRVNDNLEKFQR